MCRLVSATHHAGERGTPVCTPELVAEHVAGHDVRVLLGPASELGLAATLRRDDLGARAARSGWTSSAPSSSRSRWSPTGCPGPGRAPPRTPHGWPGWPPGGAGARVPVVLSNAVRFADRLDAPTTDVLDAARRLVPMDLRHLDRRNAEGFLKSGKQMHEVAEEICRYAGLGERGAHSPARRAPASVADQCVLDPRSRPRPRRGALPGVRGPRWPPGHRRRVPRRPPGRGGHRPTPRCGRGARRPSGGASATPRASGSGSGSTTSSQTIGTLGYASYFLTVGDVTEMIRDLGIRSAARGSGAGSLVNYLLGISGVDPIRHGLLMERFLSPLRRSLPDIDIDVESARRLEVYDAILERYGRDRCATVSMMDTYKVRHAIRDVGAALGMPVGEIDAIAKAFPHIRARDARMALRDLPELRATGLAREAAAGDWGSFDLFFRLVESLDGLPRHIAMHPCGVLLSDRTLLDRTPVEQSCLGYPMSQFDKDDVEDLGLLKLDVLGIRMQSSMAHAVARDRARRGPPRRPRRRGAGALRRPDDLRR